MADVIVYGQGLVFTSVCALATLTAEEVEAAVNAKSPTGISTPWVIHEGKFSGGQDNPCPCTDEDNRQHWLLNC